MDEVLIELLNNKFQQYNQLNFIDNDPISIPHRFSKKQDIEIAGFFAAILAWGQRKTIINKCNELMDRMGGEPYQFIKNADNEDLQMLIGFKHRTFNDFDLLYFVDFLKNHYLRYDSLEDAFLKENEQNVESNLIAFRNYFFQGTTGKIRTMKHIATPIKNSACKRINMFLRWMVRKDQVDFGIWDRINPAQLVAPCDVHVEHIAKTLGLTSRKKADWKMAVEITEKLKSLDPKDPVKYDFALFGMGVEGFFKLKT